MVSNVFTLFNWIISTQLLKQHSVWNRTQLIRQSPLKRTSGVTCAIVGRLPALSSGLMQTGNTRKWTSGWLFPDRARECEPQLACCAMLPSMWSPRMLRHIADISRNSPGVDSTLVQSL